MTHELKPYLKCVDFQLCTYVRTYFSYIVKELTYIRIHVHKLISILFTIKVVGIIDQLDSHIVIT